MMPACLKDRLRRGEVCKGTFLLFIAGGDVAQFLAGLGPSASSGSPLSSVQGPPRAQSRGGFDYFFLDTEHSTFDLPRVRETILAARASGIAAIVRVADMHYDLVARVLDAGAEGILLPRVETRDEVEKLVKTARYRPEGERGISTFAGHNDFTRIPDVPAFLAERNRRILLFVQIETVAGVANREAILSTPGLDGCFIGTGDLAMGMGYAGQPDHPEVLAEAEKVLETARTHGLLTTIPIRTPDRVRYWRDRGLTMLTLSTDGGLLSAGAGLYLSQV